MIRALGELRRIMTLTLKTCRQFLPLSLSRLSSISMISTKSFLNAFELVGGRTGGTGNGLVVGKLGNFVHLGARGTPRIIRRRIADLCLHIRVAWRVL